VVCRDKDAYNAFLDAFLFRLPGIAHVRTNLVLKEVKLDTKLPV
jgi:DNA-binding Lrp family transcriptional regulator